MFDTFIGGAFTLMVLFFFVAFVGYLVIEMPYVIFGMAALTTIAVAAIFRRD